LALAPRLGDIPFNLANLLERTGKPCEALFPVEQYLFYHPSDRDNPAIQQRLATIYQSGSCKDYTSGHDQVVVRFQPGSKEVRCKVRVNDTVTGTFILDTGASYVTLSRGFAEHLGIYQLPSEEIIVQTAAGISSARLTTVDLIDVGGLRAERVNVAIIGSLSDNLDGLLGLSFLSRFDLSLDSVKGTMKITRPK
jgi:aspartyl protease family protein